MICFVDSPNLFTSSRSLQTLAYEEIRSSGDWKYESTALTLHGLLGSGCNWRSFSRSLALSLSVSSASDWKMILVDLRNHGRSTEVERLNLVNSAKNLADLVKASGWKLPDVVIDHSLGGKVALQFMDSCVSGDFGESASPPKEMKQQKSHQSSNMIEEVCERILTRLLIRF